MADAVHIARLRIAVLDRADEMRGGAYRALGQPFGETYEAAEFAARNYYDAACEYARIGMQPTAKENYLVLMIGTQPAQDVRTVTDDGYAGFPG